MNYYPDVMKIITLEDDNKDFRDLVIEIAGRHPKSVIDAARSLGWIIEDWRIEAKKLWDSNGKVAAIKHCRAMTGVSLKEAKERVEALFDE